MNRKSAALCFSVFVAFLLFATVFGGFLRTEKGMSLSAVPILQVNNISCRLTNRITNSVTTLGDGILGENKRYPRQPTLEISSFESPSAQWNKTYGGADDDVAFSAVQTYDGGYTLAGHTRSFGAGGDDFWLIRTDSSGNVLWNKTYGGTGNEGAFSMVQTSDHGYALAGDTKPSESSNWDFWLVKIMPTNTSASQSPTGFIQMWTIIIIIAIASTAIVSTILWKRRADS